MGWRGARCRQRGHCSGGTEQGADLTARHVPKGHEADAMGSRAHPFASTWGASAAPIRFRRAVCQELRMRSFEQSEGHGVPVVQWLAIVAALATAALSVLVFWDPHPRNRDAAFEVDGEALFVRIAASQPATKKGSRVGNAASGSRIVLPQPTWERAHSLWNFGCAVARAATRHQAMRLVPCRTTLAGDKARSCWIAGWAVPLRKAMAYRSPVLVCMRAWARVPRTRRSRWRA